MFINFLENFYLKFLKIYSNKNLIDYIDNIDYSKWVIIFIDIYTMHGEGVLAEIYISFTISHIFFLPLLFGLNFISEQLSGVVL